MTANKRTDILILVGDFKGGDRSIRLAPGPLSKKQTNQSHIVLDALPVIPRVLPGGPLTRFQAARASALLNFENGRELGIGMGILMEEING